MNSADSSPNPAAEMPHGRGFQTDFNTEFDNELDYPRLGNVTFRRGTLTDNQNALFEEHWPQLGQMLSDVPLDIPSLSLIHI